MEVSSAPWNSQSDTLCKPVKVSKYFDGFSNASFQPIISSDSIIALTNQQLSHISSSATQKGAYNKNTPIFITITGGFKGDGSDVTSRVAGNSSTEEIYIATQQQARKVKVQLDGL